MRIISRAEWGARPPTKPPLAKPSPAPRLWVHRTDVRLSSRAQEKCAGRCVNSPGTGRRLHGGADMADDTCTVPGCAKQRAPYRPLCAMHRTRLYRTGSVGPAAQFTEPSGAPSVERYRRVYRPGHPLAGIGGQVFEHRLALFDRIGYGPHLCTWCGRCIHWRGDMATRIEADHLDANPTNNDPANLVESCRSCNAVRRAS